MGELQSRAFKKNLTKIIDELREAKKLYHSENDGGRTGVHAAINAAAQLVKAIENQGEGLEEPLLAVSLALGDLYKGTQHEMLKPVPVIGRKPDTHMRQAVKAFSAATMELFIRGGLGREEAAREVARHLANRNIKTPGYIHHLTWNTVATWRDNLLNCTADDILLAMTNDLLMLLPDRSDVTDKNKLKRDLLGRLDVVLVSCKAATDSS